MRHLAKLSWAMVPLALSATVAVAAPLPLRPDATAPAPVHVAADCFALGQQIAAENGGTLARASPATQGGRPVCRIVVLLPGKDGERPRRAEFVVPQD